MKKYVWVIALFILLLIIGFFYVKPRLVAKNISYTYTPIQKGNIESNVSSTGTMKAINTVDIGTQISGTIEKIYVDFNDKVKAGQVLAQMDLKLLKTNLINAKANLGVSQAQLNQAQDVHERNSKLYEKGVISTKEYNASKFAYNQALSAKKAALAAVNTIEVNIGYGHITSPINGTVIERSVEEGQTVAASFATPTLFVIAEDLSKMQILADLDESDIGYIKDSMRVRFTVQTYPEKEFYGIVSQRRLQPIEINNVVNYQVVVDVDNKNGLLLPGMTANLSFITDAASDVLLINNSALRFRPNEIILEKMKPVLKAKAKKSLPDSLQTVFLKTLENEELYTPTNFKKDLPASINGFFYENEEGDLDFTFFEVGIKTGLQSEIKRILDGSTITEGLKVINGIKVKK
ncbi:efflux RND transporter periplasmic adaptor subunit [Flavobacteriaceae bacterium F08102]|nr:efflux RND transporter periplasmic adaptor subunit [Flavobacteriaceae bacterium F08102]